MRRALHLVLLAALTASVAASPVLAATGGTLAGDATASTTPTCTNAQGSGTIQADSAMARTESAASPANGTNETVAVRSAVGYRLAALDSREELAAATERGDLEAGRVPVHDVLVLTLHDGVLADDLGAGNVTSGFLARTNGSTAPLVVRQRGTCRPPKHLVLGANVTRVVSAPADDAVHVVVDLANATMRNDYETEPATDVLRYGDELYVNATVHGEDGPTTVERTVEAFQREAQLHGVPPGGPAFRTANPSATVAVKTNFVSGRAVSLALRRPDGDVVASETASVDDHGIARATVSLAGVDAGTRLVLSATVAGRDVLRGPDEVHVVEYAASVDDATVDDRPQSVAVTANVSVGAGGFLVLHAGNASGPVVGHSGYLPPGEHDAVAAYVSEPVANGTTVVAVAHVDDRRNRAFDGVDADPRYAGADAAASVVVGEASLPAPGTATAAERNTSAWTTTPAKSTPPTTTSPTTRSTTASSTTAGFTNGIGSVDEDPPVTGDRIPGFGAALAALAVLATVAVAARRGR